MAKIKTFRCYMSPSRENAFFLISAASRGIWLALCHSVSHASSWKLTGTISELSGLARCSEVEFQTFLDECREHDLLEIWTNGQRINLVSGALNSAMERRDRQRAQARARMKRYRGGGMKKGAEDEPPEMGKCVTRHAEDVTRNTMENHAEERANPDSVRVPSHERRFTVHEDNDVVVVVVVSYKDKQQQLQPPAENETGLSPQVETPVSIPSTSSPTFQLPFVRFPGAELQPMQLVMNGILPHIPKPQIIIDNTQPSREKDLDRLKQLLPEKLQTPEVLTVIGNFYDERGFGYLKAQIDYVLRRKYRGVDGFCGYMEKAVRKNYAEYSEAVPCKAARASACDDAEEAERIINQARQQSADRILKELQSDPERQHELEALEAAALQRFPHCRVMKMDVMAMRMILMEWLEAQESMTQKMAFEGCAG